MLLWVNKLDEDFGLGLDHFEHRDTEGCSNSIIGRILKTSYFYVKEQRRCRGEERLFCKDEIEFILNQN